MLIDPGQILQFASICGFLLTGYIFYKFWRSQKYRRSSLTPLLFSILLWFGWFVYSSTTDTAIFVSEIVSFLPIYGFVLINIVLLQFSREYLRLPAPGHYLISVFSLITLAIFVFQIFAETTLSGPDLPTEIVIFVLLSIWLLILILGLIDFVSAYRRELQPLHQNRLLTWLPLPVFNILTGIFTFSSSPVPAVISELIFVGMLGFLVLSSNLPDLKNLFRRFIRFCLIASGIFVYILLFVLFYGLLREFAPQLNNLFAGILVVILASLFARPSIELITRTALVLIPELSLQAEQILREFSRGLRSSPTLDDLVYQLIARIQEILPVNEVVILNVEKVANDGKVAYRVSGFQNLPGHLNPLLLPEDDPIFAVYLSQNKPLSQYQIDYTPDLEQTTPVTRVWFESSGFDLFVPIVAKELWIGLICLGSKENSSPYTSAEIEILQSLSDQTAIAFENARLISGLSRLNNEYRRAYTAMERTNLRLEETIRQLEKLDRFKSDFITVLSHEIRTPMTLIAGYANILLEEPDIVQNPEWAEIVKGITVGTERLEDIVGAILDMASINARALDLSIKSIDIRDLVEQIVSTLAADLNQRQISIEYDGLSSLPFLESDPQLLEKALHQVLSNSIKYSPDDSRISLNGRQLLPEDSPIADHSVEITISDQGIGLDPDQLQIVFEKLYQTGRAAAHSSGKTKYKGGGPGLGLAIVKGIITELYGTVWAESTGHDEQEFPGTTIHIVLPLRRAKTGSTPNLTPPINPQPGE